MSASPNDKPRRKAGLCGSVRDRAGKRVNGFEPSTFTLATLRSTTELHPQGVLFSAGWGLLPEKDRPIEAGILSWAGWLASGVGDWELAGCWTPVAGGWMLAVGGWRLDDGR